MNRLQTLLLAGLICLLCGAGAGAGTSPWWDCIPRFVVTTDLKTALDYHANMSMNSVGSDPGWGPWFTAMQPGNLANEKATKKAFDAAGIKSISYTKAFGSACTPITSVGTGSLRRSF